MRYILNAELSVPALSERIAKIHAKPLKTKAMTLADRLREEGKQEGLAEGRLRTLRESVLRALEIRHGGYPEGIREALEGVNDPAVLDRLVASAFRSGSLEEFARNL